MANKLPFDDEQDILNATMPVETDMEEQDDDTFGMHRTPAAQKYFDGEANPAMVGQVNNSPDMETFRMATELPEITPVESKPKQESLLEQYKNLMQQRQDRNRDLSLVQGGNQIAQAIASGYGAKIGDGSEHLNQLRKDADMPVEQLMGQEKVAGVKNSLEMNDATSDISKFAQERAMASATKMGMKPETISSLSGLTAKQLEQIGLFKADAMSSKLGLYYTTIRDQNGNDRVVGVDRQSGKVVTDIGGKTYSDKIIKNPETDQNQIYRQGSGLQDLNQSSAKTKDVKVEMESPTSLAKVNPKLYDQFKKDQESFIKDIKENREVATGATTLASKLKAGKNGEIDSGLLGGIQTQAAKMAGQKGVLTDQDLVKFAGAGGVTAAIDRIVNGSFFGEMSDQDIKFFRRFAQKMQEANSEDIKNRSEIFVKNTHNEAKNYLPGLEEKNVSKWLNVESGAPASQKEMVKVVRPDGKTGSIPKENLKKALDQGYKEVK
jgi:hypothetical protein